MSPVSPQRCLIVQLAGTSCAGGDRCLMGTPVPCPPRATPNIAPGKGLLPLRELGSGVPRNITQPRGQSTQRGFS